MQVIVESGGTKSTWATPHGFSIDFEGINPQIHHQEHILNVLQRVKRDWPQNPIKDIIFYGAGCSSAQNKQKIISACKRVLKAECVVKHDLLAACRASLGHKPGIVGILGTGSNACYYDGQRILAEKISLGYVMGDEGSGAYMGKQIIKAYVNAELDTDLSELLFRAYQLNRKEMVNAFYQSDSPSAFLGQFAKFIKQQEKNPYIQSLIKKSMQLYRDRFLMAFSSYGEDVYLVGSVAQHFENYIAPILSEKNLTLKQCIAKPFKRLLHYHSQV